MFQPTVRRRLLARFDWSVRSYALVLAQVGDSQNSASVLGSVASGKPCPMLCNATRLGCPGRWIGSSKEGRLSKTQSAWARMDLVGCCDRHGKPRDAVVVESDSLYGRHSSLSLFVRVCSAS